MENTYSLNMSINGNYWQTRQQKLLLLFIFEGVKYLLAGDLGRFLIFVEEILQLFKFFVQFETFLGNFIFLIKNPQKTSTNFFPENPFLFHSIIGNTINLSKVLARECSRTKKGKKFVFSVLQKQKKVVEICSLN